MAITKPSSKRSRSTWEPLHNLPLSPCSDEVARWVDDVPTDDAPSSTKRQRILRDLPSTSQRLNVASHHLNTMASPTRRSARRMQRTGRAYVDAHSAISAPSFSAPTSSLRSLSPPKKKTASTKADLTYLNPNIEFHPLRNIGEFDLTLPQSVTDLWSRCEHRQRNPLIEDPPITLTENDIRLIDDTLSDAFEQAEKWRDATTEPHWISVVVGPILQLLRRMEIFKKAAVPNAKIAVLDVSYTEISPVELVPFSKDPLLYRDLDKRIDYVVGLDLHRTTLKTLRRSNYYTSAPSINQTTSFANESPIFLNIEVKRRHVARDPTIQLAAWVAAEFTKRRYEGWPVDFPVFTIEVDGDTWFLRVATARVIAKELRHAACPPAEAETPDIPEDEYELIFLGPLALGSTLTIDDTRKLFTNLLDIARWGQCDFRTWWEDNVYEVLEQRI